MQRLDAARRRHNIWCDEEIKFKQNTSFIYLSSKCIRRRLFEITQIILYCFIKFGDARNISQYYKYNVLSHIIIPTHGSDIGRILPQNSLRLSYVSIRMSEAFFTFFGKHFPLIGILCSDFILDHFCGNLENPNRV